MAENNGCGKKGFAGLDSMVSEVEVPKVPSPDTSPLFASDQVLADLNNHSQARSAIADPLPLRITIPAGGGAEIPEIIADEEAIYAAIADEMVNGKVRKGLWMKLWTEAEGDDHKAKLAYIKARVNEIAAERQETLRVASEIRAKQETQREEDARRTADARKLEDYIEKYSDQLKDLESRFSYTPLHFAAENNLEEFVRLLLKSGAEKNATDRFGQRALDLAKKYRHGNLVKLLSVHPDAATTEKQATSAPEANPSKESAPSSVPAQHNLKNEEPSETADDSVQDSGNRILGLYKASIGEKNTNYYTAKFEQFDRQGAGLKMGWNWPAFLCGGVWPLYRKMYGWFFAFFGIAILSDAFYKTGSPGIGTIIFFGPLAVFAVYANSIYHGKVRQRIATAQIATRDEQKLVTHLRQKGGVHNWVIWVFGFVPGILFFIGILAAIIAPAFNDSQQRAAGQQSQQPAPGSEEDPLGLYRGASPQNQQPATGGYGPNDKPVD